MGVIGHWFLAGHLRDGFEFGPAPAVTAAAVLVTMEASLWFIVHRRQPVGSESQMMLDDALRSTTIHRMAATGVLAPLTRLPSIRQLARDLGLATATVARAFRELECDGVIETRGRHGTYVCEAFRAVPAVDSEQRLAEAAQEFAVQARQLGVDATRALRQARLALEVVAGR